MAAYDKVCVRCGTSFVAKRKDKVFCRRKCKEIQRDWRLSYRAAKDTKCASCGFVALHKCQLDVDHIDGDHSNDDPSNLQTLCANCHRLKTYMNGDHLSKGRSSAPFFA